MSIIDCPEPELCERLGRHLHGHIYQKYKTDEKFRKLIESTEKGPGIIKKMTSFGNALFQHVICGLKLVSEEKLKERLGICDNCEMYKKEEKKCGLCGCHMQIKAEWLESRCPHPGGNKWEKAKQERLAASGQTPS